MASFQLILLTLMSFILRRIVFASFPALVLVLFAVPLILTAQDSSPSTAPAAPATPAATAPQIPSLTTPDTHLTSDNYILRANDFIRITVFQEDDLLTEARITKSGYINFPLLGPIHLAGKTVGQAVSEIRTRLDKDYIINPQVTLTLLEYAKQWVTVLGEVQKPGQVEIPPEGGLDLLGAIALAGGYTRVADPSRVIVRREVDGHDVVLKVNAKQLARDVQVQQFMVQPGDSISVAESLW
jgi:polysaccharide export outer membrane protein